MDLKVRWIEKGGDFSDAAKVRKRVFVEEQSYSLEEEFDSLDSVSEHLVLYDKDKEIACGRLIDLGGGAYKLG
ncbi:MAG TPA: GNAT family N-acyltransferase, partial [Clostridiales bacterium]|nr:GNAT family N-acyltransferase [Clostridiales bacterium]